jgi:hypothetical protein
MRFSVPGLHHRLLIPDDAKIVSAGTVEHYALGPVEADTLVLTIDMPDAHEGATSVEMVYHDSGHRDPVEFERLVWRAADGTEIETADDPGKPPATPDDPFADKAAQRGG